MYYLFDLKKALLFFCILLGLNLIFVKNIYSQNKKGQLENLFEKIVFNAIYYPAIAEHQLDSIAFVFTEEQLHQSHGYIDLIRAILIRQEGELDSVLESLESALSFFTLQENNVWLGKCYFRLGELAEFNGMLEEAKENYQKVIFLNEEEQTCDVGFAYFGLARCKKALREDYQRELNMGLPILQMSKVKEYRMYGNLMEAYSNAIEIKGSAQFNQIAEEYDKIGNTERVVSVYKIIATGFKALDMYDSAHFYCDKAITYCEKNKLVNRILPAVYQLKGSLFYKQGNFEKAKAFMIKSLDYYKQVNAGYRSIYALAYLNKIYVDENDYKTAYDYLDQYVMLIEELSEADKMKLAKFINKVDLLKEQLERLKMEKKASVFAIYLIIVITLAVFGAAVGYFYNYKKNKKKAIADMNKEFHNLLMGIGEKQLLEHRLSLNNKKVIQQEFQKNQKPTSDMGESFDHCYMETINLFTSSFPQLTKTEVRYAVMLCLKLPMEIIAKVQNVQTSSIRKAKQRIRAKLDVEDNLEQYLQDFREQQISNLSR